MGGALAGEVGAGQDFARALGGLSESGGRGAGAEGGDADAVGAELDAEGFGEAGDVGFARGVDGEVGHGQFAGERANVENSGGGVALQEGGEEVR